MVNLKHSDFENDCNSTLCNLNITDVMGDLIPEKL